MRDDDDDDDDDDGDDGDDGDGDGDSFCFCLLDSNFCVTGKLSTSEMSALVWEKVSSP